MRFFFQRLGIIFLALIVLGIVAYFIAALTAKPAAAHPWFTPRPGENGVLVFAHQGGEEVWPSNTMLAFENSAALGADVLDTDMHITKDGVLVLMHDQTVDRTTDGSGAIRDLMLAEIKKLDAAYTFSLDDGATYPYRGQGHTVPTLEELFQTFPDKRFGIEIKQTPSEVAVPFCALIRQYGMEDQVLVSSFRQANMDAFRAECPEVATSATEDEVRIFFILNTLRLTAAYSPNYHSLQVPEAASGLQLLTPHFVQGAHSRGLAVQPWTINDPGDMQRLIAMGVDGLNTDRPDLMTD